MNIVRIFFYLKNIAHSPAEVAACERVANNMGESTSIFQQLSVPRVRKLRVTARMRALTHAKVHAALSFAPLNEGERGLDAVCNKEETKRGMIQRERESVIANEPVIRLKVLRSKIACQS